MEPSESTPASEKKNADARWKDPREERKVVALQDLIDAPKGKTLFKPGESFGLHVVWEVPHLQAANELLDALNICATATHRDTPCVTTYVFHISTYDADIASPTPLRVGDHPAISDAQRKLKLGLRPPALESELTRRRIDPKYLTANPEDLLPPEFVSQTAPLFVEFTEVYLDEAAFMQHAHSRDYLAAYSKVMNPALIYKPPTTFRFGTPPESLVERILSPILREVVVPPSPQQFVWKPLQSDQLGSSYGAYLVFDRDALERAVSSTEIQAEKALRDLSLHAVSLLAFPHPYRQGTTRTLCILPIKESAPHLSKAVYDAFNELGISRGAVFITGLQDGVVDSVKSEFGANNVHSVGINPGRAVGYALHQRAADITESRE